MLDYEWGNSGPILLPGEEANNETGQGRQVFDPYAENLTAGNLLSAPPPEAAAYGLQNHSLHQFHHSESQIHTPVHSFDGLYSVPYARPPLPPSAGFSAAQAFQLATPKVEEFGAGGVVANEFPARIGLNLGGRTYFASSEDDFVSRLYRRPRAAETGAANAPQCQAEGCATDLSHAKHYHRRHKVCEFHSKASTVIAAGLTQRFCQQCSRFHVLSEFDQGKRSCRKRLADHNRRRRKNHSQPQPPSSESLSAPQPPPVENTSKSSSESGGTARSSSVTVAISPPYFSFESFGSRLQDAAASSSSSNSRFSRPSDLGFRDE